MELNDERWRSERIDDEQRALIDRLRARFDPDGLPPDLDTELNLRRWIRGHRGDLDEASRRLKVYVENRRACGLDKEDFGRTFFQLPVVRNGVPFYSQTLTPDIFDLNDNTLVSIQRLEGTEYHRMPKILTCSQFLRLFFACCERDFRQVLRVERETGRESGISLVHDLENFNLLAYINPNSPIHRINKLCLRILQDYYCDVLHRMYIVNAPAMLHLGLGIVKKFLNPNTQQKLRIVADGRALLNCLHPQSVPVRLGGVRRLNADDVAFYHSVGFAVDPETCVTVPRPITDQDHYVPRSGLNLQTVYIRPKQSFQHDIRIDKSGAKLFWQFQANADVQFTVLRLIDDSYKMLSPRWTLTTVKLPEEGELICETPGVYRLEFENQSTVWFSLKLDFCTLIE